VVYEPSYLSSLLGIFCCFDGFSTPCTNNKNLQSYATKKEKNFLYKQHKYKKENAGVGGRDGEEIERGPRCWYFVEINLSLFNRVWFTIRRRVL